ncbi:MAG: hypothetical protein WDN30_16215, partial [Pararobbsia sp.]
MLNVGLAAKNGALNATVSALDALLVSAEIASAASLTSISVKLETLLPPNPLVNGSLQIKIGQPPVLAVGEAGQ